MSRTVLVTGCGGTGLGAAVLQALAYSGDAWDPVAADAHPFSWGLYRAARAGLLPWADDPGYLTALQAMIAEHQIAAVIPGTEAETVLLAERRYQLQTTVIANRARLMPLMTDKEYAQRELARLALPFVPSYPWAQRERAIEDFGFPLVVKPTKTTSASRGVFLVTSPNELMILGPLLQPSKAPVVQPYLGDVSAEYSVMVLSDRDGTVIDSLVIKRELTGFSLRDEKMWRPPGSKGERHRLAISTGYTQGYIVRDAEIQGFAEQLAKTLGSCGPLDLQLRIHGGQPHLFEVQPRFSFSSPIRAACGFNEPDVLLRSFLDGEEFTRLGYRDNVAAIRAFTQLLVPVDEMLR